MNTSWKSDPRLKNMDPVKLNLMVQFAEDLQKKPKDQMMQAFLGLNQQAAQKGLNFTDSETELIVSIMTEDMPPAEQKKLQMLKMLAKKLAAKGS